MINDHITDSKAIINDFIIIFGNLIFVLLNLIFFHVRQCEPLIWYTGHDISNIIINYRW